MKAHIGAQTHRPENEEKMLPHGEGGQKWKPLPERQDTPEEGGRGSGLG